MSTKAKPWEGIPALVLILAMVIPFLMAWQRLYEVSELGLLDAVSNLDSRRQTKDAFSFSLMIGLSSAVATALIGTPLAFLLGRWKWPAHNLIKTLSTLPFIVPSIVAAMGFIELTRPQGLLHSLVGLDLIGESGTIGWMNSLLGVDHGGWLLAILLAHIWFNLALFTRLVEPVVSRLDEDMVEQIKLLPGGQTKISRIRNLWYPLLWPYIASAMILTFVFCFTSFAIILHLGGFEYHTMERAMAELGGAAGICASGANTCYGASASEVVLALSSIQLLVILSALWLQSRLARRRSEVWPLADEQTRPRIGLKQKGVVLSGSFIALTMIFLVTPMILIFRSSLKVRGSFSTEAWIQAFSGEAIIGGMSLVDHLANSILYAMFAALLVIPFALLVSEVCIRAEKRAKEDQNSRVWNLRWSSFNENLALAPLALSSVMIGYGVLLGIMSLDSSLIRSWWLPLIGHCMVALPFAVRSLLQPMRNLDPQHEEIAATLGLSPMQSWWRVRMRLLRAPIIIAMSLVLAISLGEFGAGWVMLKASENATLPMFIDAAIARPFDRLARPLAMVAASILLACCTILHLAVERLRSPEHSGGL